MREKRHCWDAVLQSHLGTEHLCSTISYVKGQKTFFFFLPLQEGTHVLVLRPVLACAYCQPFQSQSLAATTCWTRTWHTWILLWSAFCQQFARNLIVLRAAGRGTRGCTDFRAPDFFFDPGCKLSLFFLTCSTPPRGFAFIFNLKCYVPFQL